MKDVYKKVYEDLLNEYKGKEYLTGYHKHRIVPGYLGGTYDIDNIVCVPQRVHSIIHFLRWKLFKDSRDKRAQKMIGIGPSGLSHQDRVDHGIYCANEKIGFFGASTEKRAEWARRGWETQKKECIETGKKNYYYWSTEEGRRERASLGGTASCLTNIKFREKIGRFKDNPAFASECARLSPKKPVTNGKIIRKFRTDEEVDVFLSNNETWRRGCLTKNERLALGK